MGDRVRIVGIAILLAGLAGCGAGNINGNGVSTTGSAQHVVVVVFENQDYANVIGNPQMPFFNSLATQNALATQFYANTHPSIGNYFMMTTGQTVTNDDNFTGVFSGDNVVRELTSAGKTWKAYVESLPSEGYVGGDVPPYVKHHNPFAYFEDVINNQAQSANVVPFSQFASDLSNNALPNYSFVVPNDLHDGQGCPDGTTNCTLSDRLAEIDSWLSTNMGSVLNDPAFMNNGVLIVTMDESGSDNTNGGGRIPVILAGAGIKTGYQSTTTYQFPSLLQFSLNELGVTSVPGSGAGAPGMGEFLK